MPPEHATYRTSTAEFPERDHLSYWQEILGRQVLGLEIEALSDVPYRADLTLRALPGLRIVSGTTCELRSRRTRQLTADGNSDFGLTWARAGGRICTGRGRDVTLHDGDAVLLSWAEAYETITPGPLHWMGLAIPHAALAPLVPNAHDAVMRVIPGTEALRLLTGYVGLLMDNQGLATPELRRLGATYVYDLAALVVGASRDAAAIAEGRGLRAARLRAVKADVAAHLARQDLSAAAVAARLGLSPRYVQMLFEDEGITFSRYVLNRRLVRAHRLLAETRTASWTIAAIGLEAGFGDLPHFNRAFRRTYGASPSEVREAARSRRE